MNEKIELEEKICDAQKEIADNNKELRNTLDKIKKLQQKLEVAQAALKVNVTTMKNHRSDALYVDLKEYIVLKETIEDLNSEIEIINKDLSPLIKDRDNFENVIKLNNKIIEDCQTKLNCYGKIIDIKTGELIVI